MTCYHPIKAYQHPTGGKPYFTQKRKEPSHREIQFPCGQCWGCRVEHSRQWAIRCVHESKLYEDNMFLTLTYNEESLPQYGSLNKEHMTKFLKELRHYANRKQNGRKIRYLQCGEYGDLGRRPHHHAIIFNLDMPDKIVYSEEEGIILYTSDILSGLWSHGFVSIGDVTFSSAAYVAGYIMKKVKVSDKSPEWVHTHYFNTNPYTGEMHAIEPEYATMSLKPGLGEKYYEKYKTDFFPSDEVTHEGKLFRVPAYYDKLHEIETPLQAKEIKSQRRKKAEQHAANQTPDRLLVREKISQLNYKTFTARHKNI